MTTHIVESKTKKFLPVSKIQYLIDSDRVKKDDVIILRGQFRYEPSALEARPHRPLIVNPLIGNRDPEALYLWKSVTLRGDRATIFGGKQIRWGMRDDNTMVQIAATIENIWFKGFTTGAIRIYGAVQDSVIRNCRFEEYRYGADKGGAWPIVVEGAKPSKGSVMDVTGSLEITNCHFGCPDTRSVPKEGMNNMLHVDNCNLDHFVFSKNVIEDMYWMGIAVFGVRGLTEIVGNTITKKSSWIARPGAGAGIGFGLRPIGYPMCRDGSLLIARNTINIDSSDSYGIVVGLYAEEEYLPSDKWPRTVTICDNVVNMGGKDDLAALACRGACSNSSWTKNVVTGMAQFGIWISQDGLPDMVPSVGKPTTNIFQENQFAGGWLINPTNGRKKRFGVFTASQAQVFVAESTRNLYVRLNTFGHVSGSNSPWPPPLSRLCAGILWCGSDGWIFLNDFREIGTSGWPMGKVYKSKTNVGCIYLSEMSSGNSVSYFPSEFPSGKFPPEERQILDLGNANTTVMHIVNLTPLPTS